jgi:hypothetical protein
MQESADKAVTAASVVITAARPVAVVGKMLEHQVELLHSLCDWGFRHWFALPIRATNATYHGKRIGSTKSGSLFLTFPTRGLTGQQIMSSAG